MITPITPAITPDRAPAADTPVIVFATLRNNACAPRVNTSCSRRSAVYALTMRMPPSVSPSRPVSSALIRPRSRNSGRMRANANVMPTPNTPRKTTLKQRQLPIDVEKE
jgi:hypothetical protein